MRRITTRGGPLHWPLYALAWPVVVLRLSRLVLRLDIDVVHTNSLHSWYGWAAAVLTRRPHVWSAREIAVQSEAAARLERFLTRHFAEVVVSMSHAIADELNPRRSRVFFEDVDPTVFRPDRAGEFRRAVGIPDDVVLIGAAGRIDVWKGFDVLLDAFELLEQQRDASPPAVHLVVCGPPVAGKEWYEDRLRRRADTLPNCHWLGSWNDMPAFHADLDAFVLPSTEPEPFGLVVVEALASGVPVVATDHGGPPELLRDRPERGRLVPPNDPGALARAIGELIVASATGGGATSAASRGARPRLHEPETAAWADVLRYALDRE